MRATERDSPPRLPIWVWQALVLIVVTALAYGGSFDGDFVSDDLGAVRDNPHIRALDWQHVWDMVSTFDGAHYVPVKVLSLALDYRIWGPQPTGFHISNLVLHIASSLLVYALLQRLRFRPTAALVTALLWSVHPLQVESVAWISERKNVLSTFFFLAAFYLYVGYSEHARLRSYVAIIALFILAALSKMNTVVLPAVCLAYEATFRYRLRRRDLLATLPMFAIGAVIAWYNIAGNRIFSHAYHGGSALVTWSSSAVVIFRYLRLLVLPTGLSSFYEVPLRSPLSPTVLLALLCLTAVALGALRLWCRRDQGAFWFLWFVITISPMINIIPFPALMQDRYMYLPMLGPLALAIRWIAARHWSPATRRALAAVAIVVICAYAMVTYRRVEVWSTPLSYWHDWATRSHYIAADERHVDPDLATKVSMLRTALAEDPDAAVVHGNLGALYFQAGQIDAALPELETATRLAPDSAVIALNLGRAYARAGRLPEAQTTLRRAAVLDPYSFMTQLNLARVELALGNTDAARSAFLAAAEIRPHRASAEELERQARQRLAVP